nr:unnamed protein product [Callosobruchus analis]
MPRLCCVPRCKSNYKSTLKMEALQTTFSFPKEANLRMRWLKAIHRDNYTLYVANILTKMKLRGMRFFKDKDGTSQEYPLARPKLKEGFVPHIFENLPKYMSVSIPKVRRDLEQRKEDCLQRKAKQIENFLNSDLIADFDTFKEHVQHKIVFKNWSFKVATISTINEENDKDITTLELIADQLALISAAKKNYSVSTLIFSMVIFNQSSSTYEHLRDYLTLPTSRRLKQITSEFNISPIIDKSRSKKKIVCLLIDEIFIKTGLQYKAKNVTGFAENNPTRLAKTVQTFMISSAFSNFKEVGIHKRNPLMSPIIPYQDEKIDFLHKFLIWLDAWHQNKTDYFTAYHVDEAVQAYICGYVGYSLVKKITCKKCSELLVKSKGIMLELDYFNYLQRGGLSIATDGIGYIYHHVCAIFTYITNNESIQNMLFNQSNHQNILATITVASLESNVFINFTEICECGTPSNKIYTAVIMVICNILLNNFTKNKNNINHKEKTDKKRKLITLTS